MREGRADRAFLRKGEQKGGVGWQGGRERKKERERERAQPRSSHLVRVEERFEENSTLKDLSPISVETADKGGDIYMAVAPTHNKQTGVNKQEMLSTQEINGIYVKSRVQHLLSYTSNQAVTYIFDSIIDL